MPENASRRLWGVFNALIEFEHGNQMDERKERDGVELLAKRCANIDIRNTTPSVAVSLRERFASGLTAGTAAHDWFSHSYSTAMIELGLSNQKN